MGHHYVPQKYLKGFADPHDEDKVWQYDKLKDSWSRASIKKVAQESGYYAPDVERDLNVFYEKPGNAVLTKLRQGRPIDDEDRLRLAIYVGTMLRRVPRFRLHARELMPAALESAVSRAHERIDRVVAAGSIAPSLQEGWRQEVEVLRDRFSQQPPDELVELVRTPWPRRLIVECILAMEWRFLSTDGP